MCLPGKLGAAVLTCVIWMAIPALLCRDFSLAYVTEHSLYMCTCVQGLATCGVINSSQCDCEDHPFSVLRRADGSSMVHTKCLTVWYTSPLNVALLLNHSEVRHLSLVRCSPPGGKAASYDSFSVQRLERLSVSYPAWRAGQNHDVVLGRDMGVPYQEEARVAVIHTSILMGKATLKAYTVQAKADANGVLPFPNIRMSQIGLPEASVMFVTFLY